MNRPGAAAEAEYLCRQGKTGIAIVATRISSRSSSGVFVKFSTRRRVLIHMRKFFPPPACPLVRCVHVTGREPGAPSGPFSSLCLYNPFKAKKFSWKMPPFAHGVNDRIRRKAPLPLTSIAYHLSSPRLPVISSGVEKSHSSMVWDALGREISRLRVSISMVPLIILTPRSPARDDITTSCTT